MKIHAYHVKPLGLFRALNQLRAGRALCRAYGVPLRPFVPACINPMTAAWNFALTLEDRPKPQTILDVGANVSQMARLLQVICGPTVDIHSFEPIPELQTIGKRYTLALSDQDGQVNLYIPQGTDDELGSLHKDYADNAHLGCRTIQVESIRMDSLVKQGRFDWGALRKPILLKVDTEGHELPALRGFGAHLQDVEYVISEVSNDKTRGGHFDLMDLCGYMAGQGFKHSRVIYACYEGPLAPTYLDVMFSRT